MSRYASTFREITLNAQTIRYEIRISPRARYLRMTMNLKGELIVSVPKYGGMHFVEEFLRDKASWILKHHRRMEKLQEKTVLPHEEEVYVKNKNIFLKQLTERLDFFSALYGFSYGKVRVRNQTSLWGSCTRAGNLQFNFKLSYLPKEAIDYVVVHEICHLKEHNHSPRFWALVEKTIPNHKKIRKMLRGYILA